MKIRSFLSKFPNPLSRRSLILFIRAVFVLVSGWYILLGTSSYLLVCLTTTSTLFVTSAFLSKHSLSSSEKIDATLQNLTYPQVLLRHFFVIEDFKPFPENLNYSVISRPVYVLLDNVLRKFILAWHSEITQSTSFPRLVRLELVEAVHQAYYRSGFINKYDLIQYVMELYLVRLQEVTRTKSSAPTFTQIQHTAALNQQEQDQYVRAICDLLLRLCISKVNYDCEALRAVLREILSTQLLTRIVDLVSEPGFLYTCIVDLVEDDDDEEFSSMSDDDKEFLRTKSGDKKCFERIYDEPELDEEPTTIRFGTLDCDGRSRSNKFRIPKVRLFGEGLSRFAVYVIEYSDALWNPSISPEDDDVSIHLVGRRFKEFAALHERLVKDTQTRRFLRGVNFPSKEPLSSFPFNRLDREFLTSRRDLFTQYLNDICSNPEVLASEDVKEFLGFDRQEIIVFKRKTSSFIESKIGQNISRMFKSLRKSISLSDTRDCDNSMLDIDSEMYACYKDQSVRQPKKLKSLSRDHAHFLKAPPNTDVNDALDKFIHDNMSKGEKGPIVPPPEKYYNPDNVCVSIRDSRFCSLLLNIVQQAFSRSGTLLGAYGLGVALSTVLRFPVNRYFINKINLLTSENYWFVYLTKLNEVVFEREEAEEEEEMGKEEFVRRIKEKVGREKVLRLVDVEQALGLVADSLADKQVNKAMVFLIVDMFLGMFAPELDHELKPLYRSC